MSLDRLPLPAGVESSLLAAWSPAGDEIAMVERRAGTRQAAWILSLAGAPPEKLVSPDGRWVAATRALRSKELRRRRMR